METGQSTKKESEASSPHAASIAVEKSAPEPSKSSARPTYKLKPEAPVLIRDVEPAFAQDSADTLSAGNLNYTVELKEHGHLGLYYYRRLTNPAPTYVEILPKEFYFGMNGTISGSLLRLLRMKSQLNDAEAISRVEPVARQLANGCALMAYLKTRTIVLSEAPSMYDRYRIHRPRVSPDLPIPAAFAFAIQQLGAVSVADLTSDKRVIPVFPATGHKHGIPDGNWNPTEYANAVEYAKSLGMRFGFVDLKAKSGSAWWLLRQHFEEDIFELQCIIPETNYTPAMAVTHCLFLEDTADDPSNTFVDLTQFDTDTYCTILRDPHPGINLSSFEAFSETATDIWTNV